MKHTVSRRQFLKSGSALAGFSVIGTSRSSADTHKPPNIILVLTDDQRWDTMGCAGNRVIQTPNMDRLASHGVRFANNFCTTSICMSSRASILTGLYSHSHEILDFGTPLREGMWNRSYPKRLREAGYYTGFVGKWGLGGPLPKEEFDFFEGFSGQGQYYQDEVWKGEHLTERMGEQVVDFVNDQSQERPFCLAWYTKAPHVQDQHPTQFLHDQDLMDLYAGEPMPVGKTSTESHFEQLPEFLQTSEGWVRWKKRFATPEMQQESIRRYYRLITGVDIALGRMLKALENNGMLDNTVIVFTSDNGFYLGEHGLAGKWFMHEESIRTPLLIFDPRAPRPLKGQTRSEMTLNIDIAPTLLDMATIEIDPTTQGQSLKPLVYNQPTSWRDEWYYEHIFDHPRIPYTEGIRNQRWKYIHYPQHGHEHDALFDLKNDPHEEHNLAKRSMYESRINDLKERRLAWIEQLKNWSNMNQWNDPA